MKRMKQKLLITVVVMVATATWFSTASSQCDTPDWVKQQRGSAVGPDVLVDRIHTANTTVLINWRHGYIEAEGRATANPAEYETIAQCKLMAERSAVTTAREALAMQVKGITIAAGNNVENMSAKGHISWDRLEPTVMKGVLIVEPGHIVGYEADNSPVAAARVGYLINGPNSLANYLFDAVKKHHSGAPFSPPVAPEPLATPIAEKVTGLIVDASGLGGRPCMSPRIIVEGIGKILYGPAHVSREEAIINGFVSYANSLANAMNLDRAGTKPLVVKAVKVQNQNDYVIAKTDSTRIFAADVKDNFLREGRVVIVLN
ncbi:MAG: hypothetical protein KAV83_06495 [Desulfobacterales bacterium]|nr:hypothetical protein [Desulfobacterales bacterium]